MPAAAPSLPGSIQGKSVLDQLPRVCRPGLVSAWSRSAASTAAGKHFASPFCLILFVCELVSLDNMTTRQSPKLICYVTLSPSFFAFFFHPDLCCLRLITGMLRVCMEPSGAAPIAQRNLEEEEEDVTAVPAKARLISQLRNQATVQI